MWMMVVNLAANLAVNLAANLAVNLAVVTTGVMVLVVAGHVLSAMRGKAQ
jgi:hypothetical protein